MNYDWYCAIIKCIGVEKVKELYWLAGAVPVSFATAMKYIVVAQIEEMLAQKKSDGYIARQMHRCEKTISRHRKRLLFKPAEKSIIKK